MGDLKLWRVDVEHERHLPVYAAAESAEAARQAVRSEFKDDWFGDFSGPTFTVATNPTTAAPKGYEEDLIVHPGAGDQTVAGWLEAEAERRAEAEFTPGTPEYRSAVEAAGQLTLDAALGSKP